MILVRTVFQVKWGKMDEVLAGMAQMTSMGESMAMTRPRMMTALGGQMFTFVLEAEFESVDQWHQQQQAMFKDPKWQAAAARMPDVFESGRTEFYTIVGEQ